MLIDNKTKQQLLTQIRHNIYNLDLFIQQCDSWLSAEEGMKNLQTRYRNRRKAKRKERILKIKTWLKSFYQRLTINR
jgi:hypothetical protein